MCSRRCTFAAFEHPLHRVLLSFLQGTPCPLPLFLPCFSAYAASLHRRIRMFVFLIGFAYLRKWFSCAYCSRCSLAAGYVGRMWRSSATAVHIAPPVYLFRRAVCSILDGSVRPYVVLCCHDVMTLCPLLAAGYFVIMSGIVCAVLFSGRAPCLLPVTFFRPGLFASCFSRELFGLAEAVSFAHA